VGALFAAGGSIPTYSGITEACRESVACLLASCDCAAGMGCAALSGNRPPYILRPANVSRGLNLTA
jgi:hypothetical protein